MVIRLAILFVSSLLAAHVSADIEEPRWHKVDAFDAVEVRYYEPTIQATTVLASSGETSAGFRRLAGFIFGDNSSSQKIAMTAPVQETLDESNPVMAFTMPGEYSFEDLPTPDDPRVALQEVPGKTVAVTRFSGWATAGRVESRTEALLQALQERGIVVVGTPSLNQYNPPWTVPFLRRNEIMVEIEYPQPTKQGSGF